MNLLNNKYYVNGKLSLSKALGFLNEGNEGAAGSAEAEVIQPFSSNTDKQIEQISINIGYIPCYNLQSYDPGNLQNFVADMNKLKEHYIALENANNTTGIQAYTDAFGCLMLLSNFNNISDRSTADRTLIGKQQNFSNKMKQQFGDNVEVDIRKQAFAQMLKAFGQTPQPANGFPSEVKTRIGDYINEGKLSYIPLFDGCLEQETQTPTQQPPQQEKTPQPTNDVPAPPPKTLDIKAWYRFPQLNGGFFEMADSLLDSNKMTNIQDPNRKYKEYEKKGTTYGLINTQGTADTASAQSILEFFKGKAWMGYVGKLAVINDANLLNKIGKIINGYTKRELGRILDEFFKNRMVKVGEYYCIDDAFLLYCCLIAMQQAGIKVKDVLMQAYKNYVTDRAPKIVKAKFKPEDLPEDVTNADNAEKISPQKLTIKQMFQGRADKNLANYNNIRKNNMVQKDAYNSTTRPDTGGVYGDDTQSDAEFENYKKNISRSNRERIYR